MKNNDRIYVSGHNGLLGSSIVKNLIESGFNNIIVKDRNQLDLTDINQVDKFFKEENPQYVFLCAAKCGGIQSNIKTPVPFIQDNLDIQNNIIKSSHNYNVKKLLFVGSSACYPKECDQPIKEDYLLSNNLESSNEFYSIAKISGIKLCQAYKKQFGSNFISVQPTNIYGPNDKYDIENGHVVASLISKFHKAKIFNLPEVVCWGTGNVRREFIYVDDLANALILLMNTYNDISPINIGVGKDYSIKELVYLICNIVGYSGKIKWDAEKPEGIKQRLLDSEKIFSIGWTPKYSLEQGLSITYKHYTEEIR